jgi:hypothetical protein
MDFNKYIKYKNKYLELKFNQNGGTMSVVHKLYNKYIKSKDKNKFIESKEKKLLKKIKKMVASKKNLTSEGFFSFKFYLIFSQYTTLKEIEKNPKFSEKDLINAGGLWAKLYIKYLSKKYNNDMTKIKPIIERDASIS